jgi:hypothetical protein
MAHQTVSALHESPFMANEDVTRQQRGIGDNSGTDADRGENSPLKKVLGLITIAQASASHYDTTFISRTAEVEKDGVASLCAIYVVVHEVHSTGTYDELMDRYGLSVHGNARSPWRPIVALCWAKVERPYVKSTVSKASAIVTYGIENGLSPETFSELVRSEGTEKLYERCKPSKKREELSEQQRSELAKLVLTERLEAPALFDPEMLKDRTGEAIALIRCDGTGHGTVLHILSKSPEEATQLIVALGRKKLSQ